jgi:hypothetical protein
MGDLEKLASKARRDRADSEAANARKAEKEAQQERDYGDHLFAGAVTGSSSFSIGAGGTLVVLAGGTAAYMVAPERFWLWVGIGIGVIVLMIALMIAWPRVTYGRFERWLSSLPFAFDGGSYRNVLSRQKSYVVVTMHVHFASPVDPSALSLVRDAVKGAMKETEAHFSGSGLVITSPSIQCKFHIEDVEYHENRKLHLWVRRCIDRALRVIHASYPIRAVELDAA